MTSTRTIVVIGELPGPNTPLPPSNAAYHIMQREIGYGTPDREFVMFCGTRWKAANGGSGGQHKYFFRNETWWHKHVNCPACLKILNEQENPNDTK